jgi:anhydro-N-acetylmuramic acid kinase
LGDAQALANALGVAVVSDMRQADLDAGGNGAPLVPIYHAALVGKIGAACPSGLLNIGGVANLTLVGTDDVLIAFDTGPGNGLIDQLVFSHGAGTCDVGGALAAVGTVDRPTLDALLALPFFQRTGPRSVDRYDFPLEAVERLTLEDAAATLTAFTAESIALAAGRLPQRPSQWLICGGGRHNPTLMSALNSVLGNCRSADDVGLRGDFIEAEAMAFLAARSLRGLPLTYPGTTGVDRPTRGGRLSKPAKSEAASI